MTSSIRNERNVTAFRQTRRSGGPAFRKTTAAWIRGRSPRFLSLVVARGFRVRRAFTLMEMMLVLALLVTVGALVLPALRGPWENQRLLKSADLIRAQLTRARVEAMKNGRMYVFRYVTASNEYSVEPWSGEMDSLEASQTAPTQDSAAVPRQTDDRPHPLGVAGRLLPDGIQFFSGENQVDARLTQATQPTSSAAQSPDGGPPPIVFYPDGSTSDARLVLTNEAYFVEITLRGLTGMVRVSELLSNEELTPSGGGIK